MDSDTLFKGEPDWNIPEGEEIHHVQTRSESPGTGVGGDRRLSSVGSVSTRSTGESTETGSRGRRTRPSVTSSASQLATVREQNERRRLASIASVDSGATPSTTVKSGSEDRVVSSKKVLTSFSKVASRNLEKEEARKRLVNRYEAENRYQRDVLRRLIKWSDTENKDVTSQLLSHILPSFQRSPLPHPDELKSLALHYYPARCSVPCQVIDFGPNRTERQVVDLGQLEDQWCVKPEWADLRVLFAPLGLGLFHSSVEDIFLHEGLEGRSWEGAGRSGWPYLETEILNFRHRRSCQEMRDVWYFLHNRKDLNEYLDDITWKNDQNASLHHDVDWRADHLATEPTFWNAVQSDMPWQLSEGLAMGAQGPKDGLTAITRHIEPQTLSMHPFYKDAQMVRNPFRTFHRGDGFLLVLSPMAGVNYLDKNFSRHLAEPVDAILENDDACAISHCFQAFAESGSATWHRRSVEWFLVYLLTEVGTTPNYFRQGCNAPSLEAAMSSVIQDLKRRRYEKWEPKKTVDLVRDYLNCIDEVTTIKLMTHKRLDLFKVMLQDVKKFEAEDLRMGTLPDNADGESASERLTWAIGVVKEQAECFDRLLIDLRQSLDALFQLRSIEQNELAIVSDSQNKAILVFTGVTIVFLPLSFFTSYYGMNLQGIVNTNRTEHFFWKVCGSIGFAIVLVVALGAFRHRLKRIFSRRMVKPPSAMV